jgi:hypothetical protein
MWHSVQTARRFVGLGVGVALLASCGDGGLSDDLLESTSERVSQLAAEIDLILEPEQADCAARQLADDEAAALIQPELEAKLARTLAESMLECADEVALARTSIGSLSSEVSDQSFACVADSLGDDVMLDLFVDRLGVAQGDLAELDIQTAIALCLTPDELLDRGR